MKRFDGWEPKTRTQVTKWTAGGHAAAWETTREPEWDARERSLMLALAHWESGLCRRCGEHLSRGMDPMTDPDDPANDQIWAADGPYSCHCCKALARADATLQKQEGGPELASYSVYTPALVPQVPKVRKKR